MDELITTIYNCSTKKLGEDVDENMKPAVHLKHCDPIHSSFHFQFPQI